MLSVTFENQLILIRIENIENVIDEKLDVIVNDYALVSFGTIKQLIAYFFCNSSTTDHHHYKPIQSDSIEKLLKLMNVLQKLKSPRSR